MGTDAVENIGIGLESKGEAVSLGDTGFSNVASFRVALAFHFLGLQSGISEVL
jgi:hypothetical protein